MDRQFQGSRGARYHTEPTTAAGAGFCLQPRSPRRRGVVRRGQTPYFCDSGQVFMPNTEYSGHIRNSPVASGTTPIQPQAPI